MQFEEFGKKFENELKAFEKMSKAAGARSDYVQGGGGNTSVKFDDSLMAIKASGYRLGQIAVDDGYAVLNYGNIAKWYDSTDPEALSDIEAEGSAMAKSNIDTPDGMKALRPSVEAGFHSILRKYVLHTHPVYANLITCSDCGKDVIDKALEGMPYTYAVIPAINPGASLTFAIKNELDSVEKTTGKRPQIIFLMNHGLVATDDDPEVCAKIHNEVNARCARAFGIDETSWNEPSIKPCPCGTPERWVSATDYLADRIKAGFFNMKLMCEDALYPDQLVFLNGSVEMRSTDDGKECTMPCTIFEDTGKVVYVGKESSSLTIEQTLCAIAFIYENVAKSGYSIVPMTGSGKDFISNWESEKYRKQLNN